jgi:hypothetical protein
VGRAERIYANARLLGGRHLGLPGSRLEGVAELDISPSTLNRGPEFMREVLGALEWLWLASGSLLGSKARTI